MRANIFRQIKQILNERGFDIIFRPHDNVRCYESNYNQGNIVSVSELSNEQKGTTGYLITISQYCRNSKSEAIMNDFEFSTTNLDEALYFLRNEIKITFEFFYDCEVE